MKRHGIAGSAVALSVAGVAMAGSPASAQTFQSYRCADGSQFIVGFYGQDKRAFVQIDGHEVMLDRRLALSGARYSGGGIILKITRAGTTVRHARRPETACEQI
jgi:membrane-bound inhibitor of C-type lysozyme